MRPQRSLHTLSSVVFFDLNAVWFWTCRYKLKNIEETEAAKKQLQDKRPFVGRGRSQSSSIPSSYSADYFQRGREYAEKLRGGMLVWLRIWCEIFCRMMCVVSDISFADLEVIWSLMPLGWSCSGMSNLVTRSDGWWFQDSWWLLHGSNNWMVSFVHRYDRWMDVLITIRWHRCSLELMCVFFWLVVFDQSIRNFTRTRRMAMGQGEGQQTLQVRVGGTWATGGKLLRMKLCWSVSGNGKEAVLSDAEHLAKFMFCIICVLF